MTDDRPTIDRDATITLAQVEYDDLLAERAGLSRHLEDSQAEVARLRDACEGWESLAHAAAFAANPDAEVWNVDGPSEGQGEPVPEE